MFLAELTAPRAACLVTRLSDPPVEDAMLSSLGIFFFGFAVLVILPLAIASLLSGSPPPPKSALSRYYEAQPRLMLAGNIFLLTVCASGILRLAEHFGYLDAAGVQAIEPWITVPFFVTLLAFLGMFICAILKVRRASATS